MPGNVIQDDFQINMDWQLGALVSILLTMVVILLIISLIKLSGDKEAL